MYYYLIRATGNRNKLLCWDTDPMAIASRLKLLYDNEDREDKALPASMNDELKNVLPPDAITAFRKPDGTMYIMIMMEHAPDENILNKMK